MKYASYLLFDKFQGNYKFCLEYLLNRTYLHLNNPERFAQDIEAIENVNELQEKQRFALAA